jgi:hypothetical protein
MMDLEMPAAELDGAVAPTSRVIVRSLLGGLIGGVVAGGIGSRLAMMLIAFVAGDAHAGEVTEAQAIVGRFTVDGTVFLILAGAFLGVLAGTGYIAVRRWMPGTGLKKGLAYGVFLLVAAGSGIIDGDNFDFARFVSPALSILSFAVPFVVFGLIEAWFAERTPAGPIPPPANRAIALSGYGVLGALFVYGGVRLTQSVIQIVGDAG